jgi:hypothetical protein
MMSWHRDADLDQRIEKLEKIASEVIKVSTSNKILQKFWMKGINDISLSFINDELKRHEEATPIAFEQSGKLIIKDINFEISGKVDRVDLM